MVASLILNSRPGIVRHELATLQAPGPISARVRQGGRSAHPLGGRGGVLVAAWRLVRLLRAEEYDVVAAYGLKASVLARVMVRLVRPRPAFVCGVRALHVTEVERLDSPKARIASAVERLFSPLVDVYDANSRAALELLAELGVDAARLVYIPNGLDLGAWPGREDGPEEEPPLILCAARFVPRKRHEDLIHALASLNNEGVSFRAVLAGRGPLLEQMRELAAALGLAVYVELPGELDSAELRRLLERASVACLASTSEGMPGALMEAMATGVAVVGTDVGGTNELVVDGESGLLAPVYDPPALAQALRRLLVHPELRAQLAAGGRRRMERCFSLDVMLEAKQRLFVEAATRTTRASANG